MTQLYKPGDMVIMENGETVILTKATLVNDVWCYEFVIPESRGSVPQPLIERLVSHGLKVPKWKDTEWVTP